MISVIIPTYNRTTLLMERAIPSVLAQTNPDWELLVVGDGTEQATVDAMAGVSDPLSIRFWNLPHARYPNGPEKRWDIAPVRAISFGVKQARGEWVSVLADDDAFEPDHNATLLASSEGADCVYGESMRYDPVTGRERHQWYGQHWPPDAMNICQGAYILRRALWPRIDPRAVRLSGYAWDWTFWKSLIGYCRFRQVRRVVHRYYA